MGAKSANEVSEVFQEKIKLQRPFKFEGETVEDVTWRRLKAKDIIASEREMRARMVADPGDAERTFYIVAQAISRPPEFLDEMDITDYLALASKAADFLS